jgi:RNA polymerase sigma-B factor
MRGPAVTPTTVAPEQSVTSARQAASSAGSDDLRPLFVRWQRTGDETAREALVARFTPLTRSLARRYGNSSEPFEDLLQVAMLGLLKALNRFDPQRGYPFASFAVPTILGEMRRYFRDSGWAVHVPRGDQERALRVRDAQTQLTDERGRAPTVGELAQYLELDVAQVLDGLQVLGSYEAVSLDAPCPGSHEDTSFAESLGESDARYELTELKLTAAVALRQLSERERTILRLRFVEELTQTQIAAKVGVSQMQVSRLLKRSLEQLRTLTDPAEHASS